MTLLARRIDPPLRLLVVDDEPTFHELVRPYLRDFQIDHAYNAVQAMSTLDAAGPFDIVLLDLGLPGSNGFELLTAIKQRFPSQPVIVVTGYASYELAHEAGRRGAALFCDKCLETYKRLNALITRALAPAATSAPPPISNANQHDLGDLAGLEVSQVPAVIEQVALARRLAPTVNAAIVEGEASVGKLDLARLIHRSSPRADEPLAVVNARGCSEAAITEILVGVGGDPGELARVRTGTLILRGVDELPTRIQRRIANECVRQGGPTLIVTSRRHIDDELAAGAIAPELWDLVRQLVISLPPLRARRQDIADLLEATTASWASRLAVKRPGYQHSVLRVLVAYDWPGNLAEMSDLVARLVGHWSGQTIAIEQLPPDYFLPIARILLGEGEAAGEPAVGEGEDAALYRRAREHFERYFIRLIVGRHHGDKREAARTLGISYRTLCDKLRADPDGWASEA